MPQAQHIRVERSRDILDGRAGYRVRAEWGHIAVVASGGHICELGLEAAPAVNPLWRPQWSTIDPHRYLPARHRRQYGPAPDGNLLAGIAGHSLSFDHFGPPSPAEVAAGLATHGEAGCALWKRQPTTNGAALRYGCTLPDAQIEFSRTIALDPAHPVIYCEERAENLSRYDRPISWNQHVTFGPPFLQSGTTIFDMPATRSKVCPPDYSDRHVLVPDAEFIWPNAPKRRGGHADLRVTAQGRFGRYTAQLLDPALDLGFISACNPAQGLLVAYGFRRADFPWVGNWEERHHRQAKPWSGRTFCRGIEFSTTPFAIPRRDTVDQGPLFGVRTYRWLPAKSALSIRFMVFLFAVPADFGGVQRFTIARGRARFVEPGPRGRSLSAPVKSFLQ